MTTASALTLFSPAKINLFLHITGKREDGYHNLQTVFRLLDWGDTLDFRPSLHTFNPYQLIEHLTFQSKTHNSDDSDNSLDSDDPDNLPLPITLNSTISVTNTLADNLITKAAIALLKAVANRSHSIDISLPEHLPIIDIALNKVLPTGAGLGGGSSNAATTLLALNQLWGFDLDQQTLINIGVTFGADVPIFVLGQDAIAEGIGEHLTPIELPHQHYLLLTPNAHAATQALFKHPDLKRDAQALSLTQIAQDKDYYLDALLPPFTNVFEPVVTQVVPEVAQAMTYLKELQKITNTTARMTGTGSSVFLPIAAQHIERIQHHITHIEPPPCPAILTQSKPISEHPEALLSKS